MQRRPRSVPKNAKLTEPYFTDNYWKHPANPARNTFDPGVPFGVPFAPTPFRVTFHVKAGSVDVTKDMPVQFRYVKDLYIGDKRMELNVVPAFSVRGDAGARRDSRRAHRGRRACRWTREVHVTVTNGTKGAARRQRRARGAGRLDA